MHKIVRFTLMIAMALNVAIANACWYSKSNYTDYIYSVNDQEVINVTEDNGIAKYIVTNNKIVDFPITVSMKLISNEVISLNDGSKTSEVKELLRGKLQYRVLPDGEWITVQEYSTSTGSISKDSLPSTYFGKNNIYPLNCKPGDVIMIRMYVTDGMWESGSLADKCDRMLCDVDTAFGKKCTLPNQFQYKMDGTQLFNYDLGGCWTPHLVTTVIYSGYRRIIR